MSNYIVRKATGKRAGGGRWELVSTSTTVKNTKTPSGYHEIIVHVGTREQCEKSRDLISDVTVMLCHDCERAPTFVVKE